MNDTAHLLAAFMESSLNSSAGLFPAAAPSPDHRSVDRRLMDATASLQQMMELAREREFSARIYDIVKTRMNLFVYVTDRHGIVLYDSSGLRTGEDLSRMNDVYLTLRDRYGARSSRMVESDPQTGALYVAAPIRYGQEIIGVLTVVKPKDSVTPFINIARQRSLNAALITALAIFLFSGLIMLWVTLPVRKLSQYVADIQKGKRAQLPALGKTEIGELGRALDSLRKELEGKDYVEKYIQTLNHEIKSPLTALRGSVELLEEDLPSDRRSRLVSNIKEETERIQTMIERMLDLSIIENQSRLDRSEVNLMDLLEDQLAALEMAGDATLVMDDAQQESRPRKPAQAELQRNGEWTLDGKEPEATIVSGDDADSDSRSEIRPRSGKRAFVVAGDPFLLGRALSNVLRNALEFRKEGKIRCTISLHGDEIFLEVFNRGEPVPDYARHRIYERFYSLPRPATGKKSTGLGLPFVREVMELHGGSVELENAADGSGVLARLILPRMHPG
ncbi:MAG: HAMP domain-containing protein [Leptospiraceae bacterium]|nr:HAMP domain-containing protein [Leptospiraceae bacterium]